MSKWNEIQAEPKAQRGRKHITIDEAVERAVAKKEDDGAELADFIRTRMLQRERQLAIASSDYYFIICFQDDEARRECCNLLGIPEDSIYFDGRKVAERLNIHITPMDNISPGIKKPIKDFANRTLDASYYSTLVVLEDNK